MSTKGFQLTAVLRGIAAAEDALAQIGNTDEKDSDARLAQIVVDHEMEIRTMIRFALAGVQERI